MSFDYRLVDSRRAEASLRVGREHAVMAVRHTGAPLDHLIASALSGAKGALRTHVMWQADDDGAQWWGHYMWLLDTTSERGYVHVLRVRRGGGGQQGGTLVDGDCSPLALCAAIADGANRLYWQVGLRGYEELTRTPFPVTGLSQLELFVSSSLT